MTELAGDNKKAIAFLKWMQPEGPWALSTIHPDKIGLKTQTFYPNEEAELLAWLEKFNGVENCYFHLNEVGGRLTNKASKEDMKRAHWLHVDVDPRKGHDIPSEQARILKAFQEPPDGIPKPTLITFSGGGYQAFWKLKSPFILDGDVERAAELERFNKTMEQTFGGDNCHNVDRIMRLPYSINLPDKKKRDKGRVAAMAKVVEVHSELVYPLGDFKPAPEIEKQEKNGRLLGERKPIELSGNIPRLTELSKLDEWKVPERIKALIVSGHLRDIEGPKRGDDSRSGWLFDCICGLARAGVPPELIYGIITDKDWTIAESVIDKGRTMDRYARRQISRAIEQADDPELCSMNDQFAVIENLGGKCRVIEEIETEFVTDAGTMRRSILTRQSFDDFRNRFINKKVVVGETKEGVPIKIGKGKWWLEHDQRRAYRTMVFSPGGCPADVYNLWKGFAYEPRKGNCDLYLEHIRKNICNSDAALYTYVIGWMARVVQQPGTTGQTALVLRGERGTGKGVFAKNFLALFGRHGLQVTHLKHFLGNFNAHLRDCVLLYADEAFFAGDKAHESMLQSLVTEETMMYEPKGVDAELGPNYSHLIMSSNNDWVVPAGPNERRYVCCDVADNNQQDETFFKAIGDQMDNGGREALLDYLLSYDLSNFSVRSIPKNKALAHQRELTLDNYQEWWMNRLKEGTQTSKAEEWKPRVPVEDIMYDYLATMRMFNVMRRGNQTGLLRFLHKSVPTMTQSRPRLKLRKQDDDGREISVIKQVTCLEFPPLEECRASFEKAIGSTVTWASGPPQAPLPQDDNKQPF